MCLSTLQLVLCPLRRGQLDTLSEGFEDHEGQVVYSAGPLLHGSLSKTLWFLPLTPEIK